MDLYGLTKALHIVALVAWFAGMFYLPRLYVYHTQAVPGGEADRFFQVMERRLLRAIINPAMIATLLLGVALVVQTPEWLKQGWLHAKLGCVVLLLAYHGLCARFREDFAAGRNTRSTRFYRIFNEVPTLLLLVIVLLVVLKPF